MGLCEAAELGCCVDALSPTYMVQALQVSNHMTPAIGIVVNSEHTVGVPNG